MSVRRASLHAVHVRLPAGRSWPAAAAVVATALGCALLLSPAVLASTGRASVGLATAGNFAVLAGAGITNTGPTTVNADVGTFPTPSETGFNSLLFTAGSNQDSDAVAQGAEADLGVAYQQAAGASPVTDVPAELGGTTLIPGVYASSALSLTGALTLNAQGDPDAQFILQTGSTLTTAADSQVLLIGGANACNVTWQIGSSATFGTGTAFVGDVLAASSITATTGATFNGRLLAEHGAVTLDTNTVTAPTCSASGPTPTPSPTPTPTSSPTPSPTLTPTSSPTPTSSLTSLPTSSPTATATAPTPTQPGIVSSVSSAAPTVTDSQPVASSSPASAGSDGKATAGGVSAETDTGASAGTGAGQSTGSAVARNGHLPYTGLPTVDLVGAGLAMIALGGVARVLGRRRT
jgi:hypothetical protein